MGVGEGANEIPDHLLNDLRKRPVYYKRQLPNEIPVSTYLYVFIFIYNQSIH